MLKYFVNIIFIVAARASSTLRILPWRSKPPKRSLFVVVTNMVHVEHSKRIFCWHYLLLEKPQRPYRIFKKVNKILFWYSQSLLTCGFKNWSVPQSWRWVDRPSCRENCMKILFHIIMSSEENQCERPWGQVKISAISSFFETRFFQGGPPPPITSQSEKIDFIIVFNRTTCC